MNGDLEVGAGDTFGQLSTERLLDLDKLIWVNDIQYLLHLSQEHHLVGVRGYPSHSVTITEVHMYAYSIMCLLQIKV